MFFGTVTPVSKLDFRPKDEMFLHRATDGNYLWCFFQKLILYDVRTKINEASICRTMEGMVESVSLRIWYV